MCGIGNVKKGIADNFEVTLMVLYLLKLVPCERPSKVMN